MNEPKRRKGPMTAEEAVARHANDPEYQAMIRAKEAERQRAIARDREAETPLVEELHEAGIDVPTVGALTRWEEPYPTAIPILLEWFPRIGNFQSKRVILGTLRVKWARKQVVPALLEEFRRAEGDHELRWEIAEVVEWIADKSFYEDILALVQDPANGRDRQMLVLALGRLGDTSTVPILLDLLKDEGLRSYAIEALGRLKAQEARAAIAPYATHPDSWVRQKAKQALAKIDRAATKPHLPSEPSEGRG